MADSPSHHPQNHIRVTLAPNPHFLSPIPQLVSPSSGGDSNNGALGLGSDHEISVSCIPEALSVEIGGISTNTRSPIDDGTSHRSKASKISMEVLDGVQQLRFRFPLKAIVVLALCVFTVCPSITLWQVSSEAGADGLHTMLLLGQNSLEEVVYQLRSLLIARACDAVMKLVDSAESALHLSMLKLESDPLLYRFLKNSTSLGNDQSPGQVVMERYLDHATETLKQNDWMMIFMMSVYSPTTEAAMMEYFAVVRMGGVSVTTPNTTSNVTTFTNGTSAASQSSSSSSLYLLSFLTNGYRNDTILNVYALPNSATSETPALGPTSQMISVTNSTPIHSFRQGALSLCEASLATELHPCQWQNDIVFNTFVGVPTMVVHCHPQPGLGIEMQVNMYTISTFLRSLVAGRPKERLFLAFRNANGHLLGASHGKFFSHSDVDYSVFEFMQHPSPVNAFQKYTGLNSTDPIIKEGSEWLMELYGGWDAIPDVNTVQTLNNELYWVVSEHITSKLGLQLQLFLFVDRESRMGLIERSTQRALQNIASVNHRLIVILCCVVVIAICFALAISFCITWSLDQLTKGMNALSLLDFKEGFIVNEPTMLDDLKNRHKKKPKRRSRFAEVYRCESSFIKLERGLKAFIKYVPKDVVKMMLSGEMKSHNMMAHRVITMAFMDIVGFSSLCEKLSPELLMKLTTSYLQSMCEIIIASGGVLDKFIGDCIMAMWNAPMQLIAHEAAACDAALEMQSRLMTLCSQWVNEDLPQLRFRIGINTDRVLVGNFGCDYRINYTCLGDGVNLASRLESINKPFGTIVLVSEATKLNCGNQFLFRKIGRVTVPGKIEVISVYELLCANPNVINSPGFPPSPPSTVLRSSSPSSTGGLLPMTHTNSLSLTSSSDRVDSDSSLVVGEPQGGVNSIIRRATTVRASSDFVSHIPCRVVSIVANQLDCSTSPVLFHWEMIARETLVEMAVAYEKGIDQFAAGNLPTAEKFFAEALRTMPADGASRFFLELCKQGKDASKPWDGIIHFDKK